MSLISARVTEVHRLQGDVPHFLERYHQTENEYEQLINELRAAVQTRGQRLAMPDWDSAELLLDPSGGHP